MASSHPGHPTGGEQLDVLVVGAGPTGLTLAAQLHAHGARTRIVDRQHDRVHESRALAIQPRTLEVLRGLGVAQTLVERGNHAVHLQMHTGSHAVALRLFDVGLDDTAYPFLLFLSQAETEAVLGEHLTAGGVAVERGVELTGVHADQDDQELVCTLRHDHGGAERVRARYLVGCDGAHSTVRHLAGIPFRGAPYPRTFVLADLEVDGGLEPGSVHVFTGAPGILFCFPLGRPATWRMIGMRPPASGHDGSQDDPGAPSLGDLQAVVDGFTRGRLRLRDPAWLTYFRLHHRHAARYRSGRVFLAGDAAHVHSPAGAQGMNTGIQDACNLASKLALTASGVADPALLDSYQAERWPVGRQVLRFTDRPFTMRPPPTRSCACSAPGRHDSPLWRCPSRPCEREASAPSPSSTSATATAPSSRKAHPSCAADPAPATGYPTPAWSTTGSTAGSRTRWPSRAFTCCCAGPSPPGTPPAWARCASATPAKSRCTTSPVTPHQAPCTTPTAPPWPGSASPRRRSTSCDRTVTSPSAAAAPTSTASPTTSHAGFPVPRHAPHERQQRPATNSYSSKPPTSAGLTRSEDRPLCRRQDHRAMSPAGIHTDRIGSYGASVSHDGRSTGRASRRTGSRSQGTAASWPVTSFAAAMNSASQGQGFAGSGQAWGVH